MQSRTDEAIVWLEKARSANPAHPWVRLTLAATYGLKGEIERAAAELAEARKLVGDPQVFSSIARVRAARKNWGSKAQTLLEATNDVGLRKAGMLEE